MAGPIGEGDESEDGMNEHQGSEDNKDNDIIPGCYLMDFGLEGLGNRRIWVRADYVRIYDYAEFHYNKKSYPPNQAPSMVVTGQPGIGAS
jgi:hypothetical protein